MTADQAPNAATHQPTPSSLGAKRKEELASESEAVLSNDSILIWDETIDKEAAMRKLLDACCRERAELREPAWQALLAREQQGGTFVGEDVAVPHARLTELRLPLIALGIGRAGIQDRESGRIVRVMFLVLSPADPPESHVAVLAKICRIAQDDLWRKKALAARQPSDVESVFR